VGKHGGIARPTAYTWDSTRKLYYPSTSGSNPWWGPWFMPLQTPYEVNLLANMETARNSIGNNMEMPDMIITDQSLFEIYNDFCMSETQRVQNSKLVDLGFDTLKFHGADIVWSGSMTAKQMLMLRADDVEVIYDPGLWFHMTEWKYVANQLERMAQIVVKLTCVGTKPRRRIRLFGS
jgi:hypothetical protein